ncbi:MAG: hypothetical protein GOMPHAMPRED_006047 [Gomphillus americanus]|uniref:Ricin B lectin domain-containing protein n=1 Tax=Gomphillus americanus TaxID=1940652 RepID=A0A8H3EPU7_9LECA|nr:MAG: hypothetical protein GOMPHAMPRED_006047 [Gomphillus americanus]
MQFSFATLIGAAAVIFASPFARIEPRTVASLDPAATAQAQQRDNTATRAVSNAQIKTSSGQCLFVDPLSGDFRENLAPIQVGDCGKQGTGWDVITKGKHIDVAADPDANGSALIASTLTNACFNFDPRKAPGLQVFLFSCGGRADGDSTTTSSQLFAFDGKTNSIQFSPANARANANGQEASCFTVKGNVVDIAQCNAADPNQTFSFGGDGASTPAGSIAATTASASAIATPTDAADGQSGNSGCQA